MKDWMKGPFLDPSKYLTDTPETISVYSEVFESLFNVTDRYSAFHDYWINYHSDALSYDDVVDLLSNFTRCSSCEQWFDRDDLIDTEEMIGGGIGYACEACVDTLR
jgi:hypothetical protein